ncbi:MAG: Nramp family divalent metal transporter [Verrucomicrobiales bacterium]|nr:Nramp family divalent metal transporter [Verrucomicrobiales bacterium]
MNRKPSGARLPLLAFIGPGLMLAATGVGAGDLAGGAFAGMNLGVAVLWAIVLGALFKYVITEGLARWQIATETTLLEGAVLRLGPAIRWGFLVYLLLWSFVVGTALIGACGVAMHALFPIFEEASSAKIVFGTLHSLLGLALVWLGTFRFLERIMAVLVSVMIVIVLATGAFVGAEWGAVLRGLTIPKIPDHPEGIAWTLALMGGVGGTLTVLCYGYWIREKNRSGAEDLRLCRWDIAIAYFLMALFGIAMVILSDGLQLSGRGATLVVDLAHRIGEKTHPSVEMLFLIGAWSAVFSSLLGVWQAVPYLFADFWHLQTHRKSLSPLQFTPYRVDTRGKSYRGYLLALALVPLSGLGYDFQLVQKAYSVFGALVMPLVALTLLLLNGREAWVGKSYRNRWWTSLALVIILGFFAWIGLPKLLETFGLQFQLN